MFSVEIRIIFDLQFHFPVYECYVFEGGRAWSRVHFGVCYLYFLDF